MKRIFFLWEHLSFAQRILVTMSFSLLFAASVMLIILTKKDVKDALDDLEIHKEQMLKILPILLSESVVLGDYESIQKQLDGYVSSPYVQHVLFYDVSGKSIQSRDDEEKHSVPHWFEKLAGLHDSYGQARVIVGGVEYGSIAVTLSIQNFSHRIWTDLLEHLSVILTIIFLDFLAIWMILYRSLKQLSALEQSTQHLSEGHFEPIELRGGLRETAKVVTAFNAMIHKVQLTQQALKDTTNEMKQKKHWLETLLNALNEGVYAVDLEGKILYVNTQACTLLGYTEEEMLNQQAHSLFHSHSTHGEIIPLEQCPMYQALVEENICYSDKEYFTCKDSRMIPVEIFGNMIIYEGEQLGMVFAFRDIGTQKALQEKMQLLSTALEATTNAVVITDKNAIIEWANRGFEAMSGYAVGEALGHTPHELLGSGKQEKTFYEQMWGTILSNQSWQGEVINKRKNGQLYYESLHITPVNNVHGEISHFIAIKKDISKRKETEKEMEYLAFHDPLTNLPNRRLLMDRIDRAIINAKRYRLFGAIFFLDLDHFKLVNDELGHDAGDTLLKDMAKRLENSVRQGDSIARLGGDEFVILLEDLDETKMAATQKMRILAQKIQDAFILPFILSDKSYTMSISLGGTLFDGEQHADTILKKADSALYRAKQTGRHRNCFYDEHQDL